MVPILQEGGRREWLSKFLNFEEFLPVGKRREGIPEMKKEFHVQKTGGREDHGRQSIGLRVQREAA